MTQTNCCECTNHPEIKGGFEFCDCKCHQTSGTETKWEEEFEETFSGQTPLSQAILSALEYRGFYDAGKYLDDDIAEKILPIIKDFIHTLLTKARVEAVRERNEEVRTMIEAVEVHQGKVMDGDEMRTAPVITKWQLNDLLSALTQPQ